MSEHYFSIMLENDQSNVNNFFISLHTPTHNPLRLWKSISMYNSFGTLTGLKPMTVVHTIGTYSLDIRWKTNHKIKKLVIILLIYDKYDKPLILNWTIMGQDIYTTVFPTRRLFENSTNIFAIHWETIRKILRLVITISLNNL